MPPAVWLAAAAVAAVVLGLLALRGLRGDRPAEPAADVVQPQPVPVAAESDGAAPAPAPTGSLRVVATPWAELVEVIDGNGALVPLPDDPFTPLVLELTPGRYLLTLRHPDAEETAVCEAQVTVAGVVDCTPTLMAADAVAYFKAVGWWQ